MQETARGPGRPRDPQVMERDEQIYALITSGVSSRSALAEATGHRRETVYQCCIRLKAQGRVRQCWSEENGSLVWVVADGAPCP